MIEYYPPVFLFALPEPLPGGGVIVGNVFVYEDIVLVLEPIVAVVRNTEPGGILIKLPSVYIVDGAVVPFKITRICANGSECVILTERIFVDVFVDIKLIVGAKTGGGGGGGGGLPPVPGGN